MNVRGHKLVPQRRKPSFPSLIASTKVTLKSGDKLFRQKQNRLREPGCLSQESMLTLDLRIMGSNPIVEPTSKNKNTSEKVVLGFLENPFPLPWE